MRIRSSACPHFVGSGYWAPLVVILGAVLAFGRLPPAEGASGLLPKRVDKTLAAERTHSQFLETPTSDWQWQQDAMDKAAGLGNSTAGLQLLVEVAAKKQREEGRQPSIMITIANEEGVSTLLPMFVETLNRVSPVFAATTVVIAVSQPAYDICRQHRLLCFHDPEADHRNQELAKESANSSLPRNKTPLFLQIGWDKLKRLQDALETGVNILFADTDIVWLRDPLPLLEADPSDLQLTHDGWGPNIGVMYVRPTACTRVFMADWLARRNFPEARDQYEFPAAVESAQAKCPEFKVENLEKQLFPNGCCCGSQFPTDAAEGSKWVMWHAACGGDLHSKRDHLASILKAATGL